MSRSLIWALLLIAFCVLLCISSDGTTAVKLFSFRLSMPTSISILGFTGIGIVIGTLLK